MTKAGAENGAATPNNAAEAAAAKAAEELVAANVLLLLLVVVGVAELFDVAVKDATENAEDLLPVVTEDDEAKEEAEAFDEDLWWPVEEDSLMPLLWLLLPAEWWWPAVNIDKKSEVEAAVDEFAAVLELCRFVAAVADDAEELEAERFCAELEDAEEELDDIDEGVTAAPNQSKGFWNGFTALNEAGVAEALNGGLSIVAAAAAAAE